MTRILICLAFAFALGFPSQSWAAKAKAQPKPRVLDTAAVHKTYLDGDFDSAIESLEAAIEKGGPFSHEDSVFMFKHLGVMYTAKYETREKGKYYMVQLLTVEPTAKILDMYASDMIYMIFKNVQDEYESTHRQKFVDRPPKHEDQPIERPDDRPKKQKSYAWVGWTAGAVAVAGGVALTLFLLEEPAAGQDHASNE